MRRVLVIGYGNPGRLDDGLGPAFARGLELQPVPGVEVDAAYQLSVEDAAQVAGYDEVVFADASVAGEGPFELARVDPAERELGFTSHSVAPAGVLALARSLFGAEVRGWTLGIRGYEFNEFGEQLSPGAEQNLGLALAFFRRWCRRAGEEKMTAEGSPG